MKRIHNTGSIQFWISTLLFICAISSASSYHRFERFDAENGLLQNTVNDIVQDQFGFIWLATQGGIDRFDGYQFKSFTHQVSDPSSLSDNWVVKLFIDANGDLWAGTHSGGLNRFDRQTQSFEHFTHDSENPSSISHNRITAIAQRSDNELLVGTHGGGINRFDMNSKQFSPLPQTSYFHHISSITVDNQNQIWFGTDNNGLIRLSRDQRTLTSFTHNPKDPHSLNNNGVLSLHIDNDQILWIGTKEGLIQFNADNELFYRYPQPQASAQYLGAVHDIMEDELNRLWLATNKGLKLLNPQTKALTTMAHDPLDKYSISANLVLAVMISKENTLWAGTFTSGLNKYNLNTEQFHHYKHNATAKNSLKGDTVWGFSQDHKGNIWIATDNGGMNHFNTSSKQFNHYSHNPQDPQSLSSNLVRSIIVDGPDVIWAGTYDGGLNRFDINSGQFEHFRHDPDNPDSIASDHVISLYIDSNNTLWVGTQNGLDKFDRKTKGFKHYQHDSYVEHSISNNEVYAIVGSDANTLWVGTIDGGISKLDQTSGRFKRYLHNPKDPNSLPNNTIAGLIVDHQNNLWFTSYGGGFGKIDINSDKVSRYNSSDGLINDATLGIIESRPGELWISTNAGVSKFDVSSELFTNYTREDGLQENEFVSGAYLKTRGGQILFGGINGFNIFSPNKISPPHYPLTVKLTQLRIANRPVEIHNKPTIAPESGFGLDKALHLKSQLQLNHQQELVSFEFSTISHNQPKNIEYQYQLEGFDRQWVDTDHTMRMATYTDIPSGKYLLKLRAKLKQQKWQHPITQLSVVVHPAPWASWWAITAYIITSLAVIAAFISQRMKRYIAEHEAQERLSLALWGSHSVLWDWDLVNKTLYRSDRHKKTLQTIGMENFDYAQLTKDIHQDDVDPMIRKIEAHIHNKTDHFDTSYRRRRSDGSWRWCRSRARAVARDSQGIALRIVGIVEDIDELKKIQTELKQVNDELEYRVNSRTAELSSTLEQLKSTQIQLVESEKMASLVELVVGVSHELNTPLGVALTAASHVQDNLDDLNHKQQNKQLRKNDLHYFNNQAVEGLTLIANNLKKSIELLNAFKSLSPASNNDPITTFSIFRILQEFAMVNQSRNEQPKAKLTIQCPNNLQISTYPDDLIEILLQLLDNSYTHGFIGINEPQVKVTVFKQVDTVCIQYRDNGIGLTAKSHKKMFEPFYTSQRGSSCTGLGLPIIYNQVYYRLCGSLSVDSKIGEGFAITISLPAKTAVDHKTLELPKTRVPAVS